MNKYSIGYKPKAQKSTNDTIDKFVNKLFVFTIATLGAIVVIEQILKVIERGF